MLDKLLIAGLIYLVVRKPSGGGTTARPAAAPSAGEGIELQQGQGYEARIKLAGLEATFGTASAVRNKLVAAGFRDVSVTDKKGGNFEARGIWDRATTRAKLPAQVKEVRAAAVAAREPARAILYRTPADGFETTRVAVQEPGEAMRKRGIFQTPAAAWALVAKSGWTAVPNVQQLEADPSE
jgi:hypothetical protein